MAFHSPAPAIAGIDLYADLLQQMATSRIWLDEQGGDAIVDIATPVPTPTDSGPTHLVQRLAGTASQTLLSSQSLRVEQGGIVQMQASTNHVRGIELIYEPPLLLTPQTLEWGHPFKASSDVIEIDARTRTTSQRGTATLQLELVGLRESDDRQAQASKEFLVRTTLDVSLGRSRVQRTIDRTYRTAPDGTITLMHEKEQETVRAMGFTVSRSERSLRHAQR